MFFIVTYLPYLISEAIGLSGILAILFLGMMMGNYTIESLPFNLRITAEEFFKTFSFVAENFCFVYFGIAMALSRESIITSVIFVSILILLTTRALVIFLLSPACNLFRDHPLSFGDQVVIWLSGARGAIAFSLALSLPIKDSDVFTSTTQYLILFTIVVLGLVSYPIAKRFELDKAQEENISRVFGVIKEYDDKYFKAWLVRKKTNINSG